MRDSHLADLRRPDNGSHCAQDLHPRRRSPALQTNPTDRPHFVSLVRRARAHPYPALARFRAQASVALRWSSVVLVAGAGDVVGGGYGDDSDDGGDGGEIGGHSRTASSGSISSGDGSTPSPRRAAGAGRWQTATLGGTPAAAVSEEWGGGGETATGAAAKRRCLPVHLGRLSCSAEAAGMRDGAADAEVGSSTYGVAFCFRLVWFLAAKE